jgi:pyrroline-5-carboxylate reductase
MKATSQLEIGFIGGGNMAEAMVKGLVGAGTDPSTVVVSEPDTSRRARLKRLYKVAGTNDNQVLASSCRVIVLAVKPQILPIVLEQLSGRIARRSLVVSIAAGVRLAAIEKGLGGKVGKVRVVRCMPNTPCLVGKGAAVLCAGAFATRADLARARRILAPVAEVHVTDREAVLDPVTGLSGSGPAYVYRFAEALIQGGRKAGLSEDLAVKLTYQTLLGAAEMLIQTGEKPAALRKAVSSPGGTTVAGLAALDEAGFMKIVAGAVAAATRRSKELAKA